MSIVKVQVPMEKTLRDQTAKRAVELGFDSTQALLRYVSKALVDGRRIDFGEHDDWGEPSPEAVARWERQIKAHEAERKADKVKSFDNTEEALAYLHGL